jgi:hypothetical protein
MEKPLADRTPAAGREGAARKVIRIALFEVHLE